MSYNRRHNKRQQTGYGLHTWQQFDTPCYIIMIEINQSMGALDFVDLTPQRSSEMTVPVGDPVRHGLR
jgi:hypothetical protein